MTGKKEFGDFQTPKELARKATALIAKLCGTPDLVVEPTAGFGIFLRSASRQWGGDCRYEGYEINGDHVAHATQNLRGLGIELFHRDFFEQDWENVLNRRDCPKILVIGNPPWVTNSDLGLLGSRNLPKKTNFQCLRGLDARTGKSNFDIAEWMLIQLVRALPVEGSIAMLCKTMTARKVLRHFWKKGEGREDSSLFRIDAKASFNVAVDACLFVLTGRKTDDRTATIYSDLDLKADSIQFGFVDGGLASDLRAYRNHRELSGGSAAYTWRSGVKHDASMIMEFTRAGQVYTNGIGESFELEEEYLFPFLKSSDLGNGRTTPRKFVLVTQKHTGDSTSVIESSAPRTWNYLMDHAAVLDGRKSSIYRNRPRFSVFGIGRYSFSPWKVAISGLYKSISFVVVPPHNHRPILVDDTCYSIPCKTESEARLLCDLLSSGPALAFLRSLVFWDSKRPITVDVLRRISLVALARRTGRLGELQEFTGSELPGGRHTTRCLEKS